MVPTPLRCHAISCHVPGGLRDLTDGSASDAHINMTYVPYLHPAAVGPFRFAGYCICFCICMLHIAWHGIAWQEVSGEHAICPRLPREDAVLARRIVLVSCSSGCVCACRCCLRRASCAHDCWPAASSKQPRVAAMQAGRSRPCHCQTQQLRGSSQALVSLQKRQKAISFASSDLDPIISGHT